MKETKNLITLGEKVLKLFYVLMIIVCVYAFTLIFKELKIGIHLVAILKILSPLFIGVCIAWLFDPIVNNLTNIGLKRWLSTVVVYIFFIGLIMLMIGTIIPLLFSQSNELLHALPSMANNVKNNIDILLSNFSGTGIKTEILKTELLDQINVFISNMTTTLPTTIINLAKGIVGGVTTIFVGIVIGFFLLVSFENAADKWVELLPKRYRKDGKSLLDEINESLRSFVKGSLIDSTVIFIVTTIAFYIVGLKVPILFALFCGITNVIPYAGPYIGGIPAIIVGFSQSPIIGLMTLISIAIIQFLEGNFLQAVILSKSTRLHPVTIISGLLLFGHFFGVVGMFVSTPIIAVAKTIFIFFDNKFHFLNFDV